MGHTDISKFVNRFKRVMRPSTVNGLGRAVRFCHRERVITPYQLALSLLASCATMRVETLADIQRCFNALFGTAVAYKPFHNQLAKWRFADFMRELVSVILEQWVVQVLSAGQRGAFSEFARIVIQDGGSFAVNEALREHYPGRFKSKGPAAVELHVTMNLLDESLTSVVLTPDTHPERPQLPAPPALAGDLLLADRGYFDVDYLRQVDEHGGHFVVRAFTSINPTIVDAFAADGTRRNRLCGKRLQAVRLPKRGLLDLDVRWHSGERTFRARLVVSWNHSKREYRILVTNLARSRYSPAQVGQAYRLRWQIGVSSQGHIIQSVEVRPGLIDSGPVAWEAPRRESKAVEPSDNILRKEDAQRTRLQRAVNVEVASSHAIPVAETVDNARRQQGSFETSPIRRPSPAGYQRRHGVKDFVSTGEALVARRRKLVEEARPITVSGKWAGRRQGGGSGRSTGDRRAAKRAGREGPGPVGDSLFEVRQG